jgi:hypothetical protein
MYEVLYIITMYKNKQQKLKPNIIFFIQNIFPNRLTKILLKKALWQNPTGEISFSSLFQAGVG